MISIIFSIVALSYTCSMAQVQPDCGSISALGCMSNRDCAHLGADSLCASIDALSGLGCCTVPTPTSMATHFFGVSVDVIDRCGPGNTTTTRVTLDSNGFEILSAVDGTTIAKFTLDITHNSTFVGQVISSQGVILDNGRPGPQNWINAIIELHRRGNNTVGSYLVSGSDNVSCPDGLACRSNFLFFKISREIFFVLCV